jgi:hypothetical protein
MNDFEIFFIKTLPDNFLKKTLETINLNTTVFKKTPQYYVIDERETREKSLNEIISIRDKKKDVFIVADDILFIDGWYNALKKNYLNGDIIGFSMIDVKSGLLQDFGYDFIYIDDTLSYEGLYKYRDPKSLKLPEYRICDSVTGCAMFIKSHVFNVVPEFPLEGANRWGELIFSHLAAQNNLKTIVLSTHLYHHAISTKQTGSITKSSLSWLVEREQWQQVASNYLKNTKPVVSYKSIIDDDFRDLLEQSKTILIYGCGVNSDVILRNLTLKHWQICSGLPEEIGQVFRGKKVLDVKKINVDDYSCILITPIGYDKNILELFPHHSLDRIIGINRSKIDSNIVFYLRKI